MSFFGSSSSMEDLQTTSKNTAIPIWACALIVIVITAGAFWLFGGEHYLAHKANIDYRHFHHEDDASNWVVWLSYCLETGLVAALVAFVVSVLAVIFIRRAK
jgi:hypothetical protein